MAGLSACCKLSTELLIRRGSIQELLEPPVELTGKVQVVLCEPTSPAVVVGSRQSEDLVSSRVGDIADGNVVRRRSGGGAVLVHPERSIWVDVLAPVSLGRFGSDVRTGMIEVGQAWRQALISLGADARELTIHSTGMELDEWGEVLCFSGLGPGEVLAGGLKLVGLSQRRTRSLLRFQCQVHREDPTDALAELLDHRPPGLPSRPALLGMVLDPAVSAEALARALAAAI